MCRIKTGSQIKEIYDVQNIVTAYILRSDRPYSILGLTPIVKKACKGSSISVSENQLEELIRDTTMAFQRIKLVTANNGYYYAYPQSLQK